MAEAVRPHATECLLQVASDKRICMQSANGHMRMMWFSVLTALPFPAETQEQGAG